MCLKQEHITNDSVTSLIRRPSVFQVKTWSSFPSVPFCSTLSRAVWLTLTSWVDPTRLSLSVPSFWHTEPVWLALNWRFAGLIILDAFCFVFSSHFVQICRGKRRNCYAIPKRPYAERRKETSTPSASSCSRFWLAQPHSPCTTWNLEVTRYLIRHVQMFYSRWKMSVWNGRVPSNLVSAKDNWWTVSETRFLYWNFLIEKLHSLHFRIQKSSNESKGDRRRAKHRSDLISRLVHWNSLHSFATISYPVQRGGACTETWSNTNKERIEGWEYIVRTESTSVRHDKGRIVIPVNPMKVIQQ